ncbi:MAG: N-acetyl-gamma-glutamyl-phosphate reductase [Phycisphaerales bacterium]|nr:N-acetyl-gamma-glutamyl-phosphate reductase [Phycisphaerales bacterium]
MTTSTPTHSAAGDAAGAAVAFQQPAPRGANAASAVQRTVRCAIVGAAGYSGAELVSILLDHPMAGIAGLYASAKRGADGPSRLDAVFPRFAKRCELLIKPTEIDAIVADRPDAVFLATPNEASHELAEQVLAALPETVVIDLSGAYRLKDGTLYPRHYAFEHTRPALLAEAVYGLAERSRLALRTARLVANPGCYPTATILALAPLVDAGAIDAKPRPVVDAISGVSGAGRSADLRSHFCEVSVQPYNVLKHRHNPEIDAYAGTPVVFTPHLGPYDRGILSTIHAQLRTGWNAAKVRALLDRSYSSEPFVRVLPDGAWPSVAAVRGTNCCDIGFAVDASDGHLVMASAIDNLVKGAAGQAVQCLNIRFGLPETAGLLRKESA